MKLPCIEWSECGVNGGGCCRRGLFGGKPSFGICVNHCDLYAGPKDILPPAPPAEPIAVVSAHAPGEVAARLFKLLGYVPLSDCGCREFQAKMNAWGWIGCLWNWREIYDWFKEKWKQA